jgi:predicted amidohydrolase
MNGCEVVYRASSPHPIVSSEQFEIQNRARALDNSMYVLAPNVGTYYLDDTEDTPIDTFGGNSMIVNHRGQIVGQQKYGGVSTWVSDVVDVATMRHHRANSQWTNSMKDLKTEIYSLPYEKPIYPKNLYLDREPMKHDEYNEKVTKRQIALLQERDIWK